MTLASLELASWRWAALALLAACNSTSGGLINSLPVQVGGVARDAAPDSPLFFNTGEGAEDGGWDVELDQAFVAVGPFYFNVQPPQTQTLESGVVIVQFTQQIVVDPLDPTLYDAGLANGETGQAISVEVDLFPPDFTQTALAPSQSESYQDFLSTSSAYVAGVASRSLSDGGVQRLPFSGFITIDQSLVSPNDPGAEPLTFLQRANEGCDLDFTTQPAVLQARIDPTLWFSGIDFSALLPGDADGGCPETANLGWPDSGGVLTWCLDSDFNAELVNGLHSQTSTYDFNLAALGQ